MTFVISPLIVFEYGHVVQILKGLTNWMVGFCIRGC